MMKKLIFAAPMAVTLAVTLSLAAAQGDTNYPATQKMNQSATSQTTDKTLAKPDRFTTTEDHKLGPQIRLKISEIVGASKTRDVTLAIDEGDVKLMGKVPTDEARTKISQAVQQIKGVKSVHNQLEVTKSK